jgi:hypothetical protein
MSPILCALAMFLVFLLGEATRKKVGELVDL